MRILCAVRGGPQSEHTVNQAIALAREHNAEVVLVYVVDAEFLGYATVARPGVILKELRSTGEFMMEILKNKIARDEIIVESVVRTGDVHRQIIESVRWQDADVLVLGHPVKGRGRSTFTEKSLEEFAERVRTATGAKVVVTEASPVPAEQDADS